MESGTSDSDNFQIAFILFRHSIGIHRLPRSLWQPLLHWPNHEGRGTYRRSAGSFAENERRTHMRQSGRRQVKINKLPSARVAAATTVRCGRITRARYNNTAPPQAELCPVCIGTRSYRTFHRVAWPCRIGFPKERALRPGRVAVYGTAKR